MITVRFPSGFSVQYNDATYVDRESEGREPTKIYGADWKAVNKKWSRPAAYRTKTARPALLLEA